MASRREIRDIISGYGKQCFFSFKEVGEIIGRKNYRSVKKFVDGMEITLINGKPAFFINDIARKLDNARSG